ncbi:protein kinase, putative [Trypanosoma brucei brucei TREU927]|uniref:non-specific serine/threonine protein kinase n=1 Tax=Trypanosoma brucei brucei (strain 927/4 GUTat10.1) TaxID=185431 RepID=Q581R1_TRYB2|nr:protein kinase, putative [Trypanosoma brucei brucei TREU927]AAX79909.1 protein kinase, putative [Trypanosoma brucei]AAZ10761.1 protein kinase, putative [Trypanosoma brucei brucei TREU927]
MNRTLLGLVDNKRYVAAGLMNAQGNRSLNRLMTNSVPPSSMAGDERGNSARCSGKNGDDAGKDGGSNKSAKVSAHSPPRKPAPKAAKTRVTIGMRLKKWVVTGRIGAGSFGETFTAVEVDRSSARSEDLDLAHGASSHGLTDLPTTSGEEVCIKVEQENKNVLRVEAAALKKMQPCPYVARYLGSGNSAGMNFIVMQRLGPNLADLRRSTPQCMFSIHTTLHLGISCLKCIQGVHELGIVHRDVKPSNFVIGLGGSSDPRQCYIVDFGLARRFRRPTGEVRPPRANAGFRGTSRYASLASHRQQELGRVDDIWSLLFMLIEFITGTLPWRKHKEKEDIGQCKEQVIGPELIKNLPQEFGPFLEHLQTLKYEDEPKYDMLFSLMERAMERGGYPRNQRLDWEPEEEDTPPDDVPLSSTGSLNSETTSCVNDVDSGCFIEKFTSKESSPKGRLLPPPPPSRRFMPPPNAANAAVKRPTSAGRLMPPSPHIGENEDKYIPGSTRQEELRSNIRMSDIHVSLDITRCDGGMNDATALSVSPTNPPPPPPPPLPPAPLAKNGGNNRRRKKKRRGGAANRDRCKERHATLEVSEDLDVGSTFSPCEVESSPRNRRRGPPDQAVAHVAIGGIQNTRGHSASPEPPPPFQREAKQGATLETKSIPSRSPTVQNDNKLVRAEGSVGKRRRKEGSTCTCHCM